MAPHLSIVIPVYNESSIVASAAEELVAGLEARGWDFELIFAENGSRDSTPQILEGLTQRDPRIKWFHCDRPNYGTALKEGILRATGELVFCDEIDLCDLTFYDSALPMLEAREADMVVGSKAAKGARDERPMVRRLATRVHNGLLRVVLDFRGTDTHGLKAFKRDRLEPVAQACVVDRDLFASELVIRAQRMGRDVREIPIALHETRPPSTALLRRVPRVLKGLLKLGWAIRVRHR